MKQEKWQRCIKDMGKTVESYRMMLEAEIHRCDDFRKALCKSDWMAFDDLMDMCRNASESSNKLIIFEPMAMSILLSQQVRIQKLGRQLKETSEKSGESIYD